MIWAVLLLSLTAPPPGSAPEPEAPPSSPPATSGPAARRLVLLPFVGVQNHMSGDYAARFDADLRTGGLAGWRVTPSVSLDVELLLDRTRPQLPLAPVDAWTRQLALAPLFHYVVDDVELVIGPKLGAWLNSAHVISTVGSADPERGWTAGANGGAFMHTRAGIALGALVSTEVRSAWHLNDSEEIVGLSLAALF